MTNRRIGISYCLVGIFLSLLSFAAFGQHAQEKIDSIKQAINNSKSDSERVKLLLLLSKAKGCEDTLNKIKYANEALGIAEHAMWPMGIFNANAELGNIYLNCVGSDMIAANYYKQSLPAAQILNDNTLIIAAFNGIAKSFKNLAQYNEALSYYRKILALHVEPDIELGILGNIGVIYKNIGDYPTALVWYDSCLKILSTSIRKPGSGDISDTLQMAGLLFNIGEIYASMGQYDKALGNYHSALKLDEQVKENDIVLEVLLAIGKVYQFKKDAATAIDYYNKALENCKVRNDQENEANVYNQLGDVYIEGNDPEKAIEYGQKSLKLVEENTYYELMPATYTTLGKIYTAQKKYALAVDYLLKAVSICGKNCSLISEKDAWEELSKTYKQMGNSDKALDAYQHFIAIRDSVYNISKANEINRIDLQATYSLDSLQYAAEYNLKIEKQQVYIEKQRVYTMSGYAGLAMVLLLSFFIYRNYSQQKKANVAISKASDAVIREKQVSENLLLNILPEDVAKELKTKGSVDAQLFDHVTVLFTDFINFTSAAERFTPKELVAELHTCFKAFDSIISKYNIEKIKTVGDAYMAASGLPKANPTHAAEMIRAAIEIRDFMLARRQQLGDKTFGIRIGINSGTVVAGIVGVTKFAYDIWGDTVNIAARMEQYGEEGKINISLDTYELVKNDFSFIDRGEIDAKHKGKMRMYFVAG